MTAASTNFPEVQSGGSLIIAWQLKGKRVIVIGGGEVAAGRILACLNADALVTVICPSDGLNAEVAYRVARGQIAHVDRKFDPAADLEDSPPSDVSGPGAEDSENSDGLKSNSIAMVLVAIDDAATSRSIAQLCRARRIPVNVADSPPDCDFYFGSVYRDGPVQLMVSTNGRGPRLASTLRTRLAAALPAGAGQAVERVGVLRARLREEVASAPEDGPRRMRWVTDVSDRLGLDRLGSLTDEDVDNLLKFFPEGKVPLLEELRALRKGAADEFPVVEGDAFDGSFGFSVGV